MFAPRLTTTTAALMLGLLSACGHGGGTPATPAPRPPARQTPPAPQRTTIIVSNTQPGAVTVNVFLVPDTGADTPLGSIDAGQTKTFPFPGPAGRYTLRAVGRAGETVSNPFQVDPGSEATWDMSLGRDVRLRPGR
jgi:hypothetical protein